MPQPTVGQVHVNQPLTNLLVGFKNAEYIADEASPIIPVNKRTNIIPKINQSAFFRNDAKIRESGTVSARTGYGVDTSATYSCVRYAMGHEIPDEVRDNTDNPFDQDRESTYLVANAVQLAREVACSNVLFATANWSTNKTGNADFNQWSNYSGSVPLDDVTQWKDQIEALIGKEANQMVIGKQVLVGSGGLSNGGGLKWHPQIIDTIKYTQKGIVDVDYIASAMGLDRILVGRAIVTTTAEGVAESSVTYSRVWGKNALVYYNPGGPQIYAPQSVMTFVWNRVAGAVQYIKRIRDEQRELDIIEANSYFTHKVVVANAGLLASSVVN